MVVSFIFNQRYTRTHKDEVWFPGFSVVHTYIYLNRIYHALHLQEFLLICKPG